MAFIGQSMPAKVACVLEVGVATAIVVTVGFLVAFSLLLWTVQRLKPVKFHVRASVTKWVSLDIQMQAPEREKSSSVRRRRPRPRSSPDRG